MLRTADYKKALQNPPKTTEFEHGTRKERRVITRSQMLQIWQPAARAILLKAAQEAQSLLLGSKMICVWISVLGVLFLKPFLDQVLGRLGQTL
jgi:hypothetical protein